MTFRVTDLEPAPPSSFVVGDRVTFVDSLDQERKFGVVVATLGDDGDPYQRFDVHVFGGRGARIVLSVHRDHLARTSE